MAITFVNVGTAAAANNADVTPTLPASLASGDLLIGVCMWRDNTGFSSGTPSGWSNISGSPFQSTAGPGFRIVTKTATGSDTNPTFTFSGVPTTTVIAQLCAFRAGTTPAIDVIGALVDNITNGQNIDNVPAISPNSDPTIIVIGGKRDDWTSVDTLSGDGLTWNEIGEPSSTLGADAGLVWDYAIASGTPSLTNKTFTVTGGTAQPSAGMMFSIVEPAAAAGYLLVKN